MRDCDQAMPLEAFTEKNWLYTDADHENKVRRVKCQNAFRTSASSDKQRFLFTSLTLFMP